MLNKLQHKKTRAPWLLLIPTLVPGALVLVVGFYEAVLASLGWLPILNQKFLSFSAYTSIFNRSELKISLLYTLLMAVTASTGAVILGSMIAWRLTQTRKKIYYILGITASSLGIIMPYGVMAQTTQIFFSQSGFLARVLKVVGLLSNQGDFFIFLNTPFSLGLFWPYILKGSAFVVIVMLPFYKKIKIKHEDEARTLGSHGMSLWLRVYHASSAIPLSLVGGILFAFIFGGIEIPIWLGALKPKMLSAHFYTLFQQPDLKLLAERMALVVMMAITGLLATIIYSYILYQFSKKAQWPFKLKEAKYKKLQDITNHLPIILYALVLLLPLVWLMYRGLFTPLYYPDLLPQRPINFSRFIEVFKEPLLIKALMNGILIGTITGIYIAVAAIPAGRAFSKYTYFTGRTFAILLCATPLVVPAIVTITGAMLSSIKLGVYGTHLAVSLCHIVMTLPYAVAIQTVYQKQLGTNLEASARTLGASPLQYMRYVHLPLSTAPFVLCFTLGFLISFTETFSTQLVGAGRIVTLGALMAPTLEFGDLTRGSAYMVIFFVTNGLLFYYANLYAAKKTKHTTMSLESEVKRARS